MRALREILTKRKGGASDLEGGGARRYFQSPKLEAVIAKLVPIERFFLLAGFAPFLVWGVAVLSLWAGWIDTNAKAPFDNREWVTVVALSTAFILGIAQFVGLFRAGWLIVVATIALSIWVPLAFMTFDLLSFLLPFVGWLGALPALVIAVMDKTVRG